MRPVDLPYYKISTDNSRAQPSDLIWSYVGCDKNAPRLLLIQQCRRMPSIPSVQLRHTIVDSALISSEAVSVPPASMCVRVYRVDIMYELVGSAPVEVKAVVMGFSLAPRGRLRLGSRRRRIRREVSVVDSLGYKGVNHRSVQVEGHTYTLVSVVSKPFRLDPD